MITISEQISTFAFSVLYGIIVSFVFDLFRIKRIVFGTGKISIIIEDFIYWIICGVLLLVMTHIYCNGEIRGYLFIGIILGIIIYILLFSIIIINALSYLLNKILSPFIFLLNFTKKELSKKYRIIKHKIRKENLYEEKKET